MTKEKIKTLLKFHFQNDAKIRLAEETIAERYSEQKCVVQHIYVLAKQ